MTRNALPKLLNFRINLVIKADVRNKSATPLEVPLILQQTLAIVYRLSEISKDIRSSCAVSRN